MDSSTSAGHAIARRAFDRSDIERWYAGKNFAYDWASVHFMRWAWLLRHMRPHPVEVLEIGSDEGRSALFFLNYLPCSRLTCIDPFETQEARFDENLAEFASRLEKWKGRSTKVLPQLALQNRRFDFIYVDGSHGACDVYVDAVLSWPMLKSRGLLLFDDYEWDHKPDERDRPKLGIDTFLQAFNGQFEIAGRGYQIALTKL